MATQTIQQPHHAPNKPDTCRLLGHIYIIAALVFPGTVIALQTHNMNRPSLEKPFIAVILYDENKGYQAILKTWNNIPGAIGEFKPAVDQALCNLLHILGDAYRKRILASAPEEVKAAAEKGGWVAAAVPQARQG